VSTDDELPSTRPLRYSALRNRNFLLLVTGLMVSNVGTLMQNTVTAWLVWRFSHSPLWLGYLGLSFAVPMCVIPLFSGTIVDRIHRIRLLYVTQTGALLLAFALAALYWMHHLSTIWIIVATFLGAALLAFDNPARQALIPQLVSRDELLSAVSLNSASRNAAMFVGPALGGLLLSPIGAGWIFAINGISYFAVLVALALMRGAPSHSATTHSSLGKSMRDGFSFAWGTPIVRTLLLLSAATAMFGRSYQNLLPVFAHLWHSHAIGYGVLLSAAAGGSVVGAFALAGARELKHRRIALLGSGFAFAASVAAFALAPWLWLGIVLQVLSGVCGTVFGTICGALIQLETEDRMRGRVMSLYSITLIGLPSLGVFGSGTVAQFLGGERGVPAAVVWGAALLALSVILAEPGLVSHAELDQANVTAE
jgi:MFS family permease